jgi:hypothetical protein
LITGLWICTIALKLSLGPIGPTGNWWTARIYGSTRPPLVAKWVLFEYGPPILLPRLSRRERVARALNRGIGATYFMLRRATSGGGGNGQEKGKG